MIDTKIASAIFFQLSFGKCASDSRFNKLILSLSAIAIVIQFLIFKYFYPYASYIHGDSLIYLEMAYENSDISTHLSGYSRFLRFFSVFTSSDTLLVAFQYLVIQGSALYFLFTLFSIHSVTKVVQITLFLFMVLNPLFLHLANLVSSDGFFLSLSFIWFTTLLLIVSRPNMKVMMWHVMILALAFSVRYNALIYPVVSSFVLLFSRLSISKRLIGAATGLLLCGLFIYSTGNKYKAVTGNWQYSPFSGWLLANNAMYAYRHVDSSQRKAVPSVFRGLDNMIRIHFDSTAVESKRIEERSLEKIIGNTAYMWSPNLPLYKYSERLYMKDTTASDLEKWVGVGALYRAYGIHIIRQYPIQYLKYWLWPNLKRYYTPPVEFLDSYNSGLNEVWPLAKKWFGYQSTRVSTRLKSHKVTVLDFYPIFSAVVNIMMMGSLLCFLILDGIRAQSYVSRAVRLAGSLWLLNALFTVFSSPASLRFQAFPIMLATVFTLLILDWLWKFGLITKMNALN